MMLLRDVGEFGFIRRISASLTVRSRSVLRGIGDDAAVVRLAGDRVQVVTTDVLVEGVDFLRETIRPEQLGHKALAVNLSDIAAMGAEPEHAVVSLCIPERYTVEYLTALYDGMSALASRFGVNILGGDVSSAPNELAISITALGGARECEVCYRDGARAGDALLLVGAVGESGAGLESFADRTNVPAEIAAKLRKRHLEPEPLVGEGRWLARSGKVRAMIDVSDGIGSDLRHVAEASGVGAVVEADLLPITPALRTFLDATEGDAERYLLRTGEDFALLAAVEEKHADPLVRAFERDFSTPIHRIGRVTEGRDVVLHRRDGTTELLGEGFDHFGG